MAKEKEELNITTMNLLEKLENISIEVGYVAKNLDVETGKNSKYKATSEVDVLKAIKPLEHKYRVYSYPYSREIVENNEFENKYGNLNRYGKLKVTYRFVNIDKMDEFIDVISYGEALDSGDKGLGKAMTYADKYALMKVYKIQTGDDPDAQESVDDKKSDATIIKEFQSTRTKLENLGVNTHDGAFQEWVISKTKLQSIDPADLESKQIIMLTNLYKKLITEKESNGNKFIENTEPTF